MSSPRWASSFWCLLGDIAEPLLANFEFICLLAEEGIALVHLAAGARDSSQLSEDRL